MSLQAILQHRAHILSTLSVDLNPACLFGDSAVAVVCHSLVRRCRGRNKKSMSTIGTLSSVFKTARRGAPDPVPAPTPKKSRNGRCVVPCEFSARQWFLKAYEPRLACADPESMLRLASALRPRQESRPQSMLHPKLSTLRDQQGAGGAATSEFVNWLWLAGNTAEMVVGGCPRPQHPKSCAKNHFWTQRNQQPCHARL